MYVIAKQGQINRKIDRYDNKIFTTILCESSKHHLEYDNENYFLYENKSHISSP